MITSRENLKPFIELTGEQGNAFYLLGVARNISLRLKLDWISIKEEMCSSDYENLILVFDKYFGQFVDLVR